MSLLITGAAGFIGSNLLNNLIDLKDVNGKLFKECEK
jgi:nucleoside-diphosphate-sugar epimerase